MVKTCQTLSIIFIMFIPTVAHAIDLRFPVACRLMDNCWITNHVDLENRTGKVEDYMCGKKATDSNKSTHISLASRSAVNSNIPVIAVANGEVKTAKNIGGFCGVRVAIEHDKGWESSYCHLKENSLQVREGQIVKAGQILGAVGMSGQTNWPRLSYALLRNGMIFDPFGGRTVLEGCSDNAAPMWTGGSNPLYEPANVTSVGFSNRPVGNSDILNGTAKSLNAISNDAPQLSLWGLIMNVREKDQIDLSILTPDGRILNDYKIIAKSSKDYFPIYFPTLQKNILWDVGVYTGRITLTRNVNGNNITTGKKVLITMN